MMKKIEKLVMAILGYLKGIVYEEARNLDDFYAQYT
jgi:hypothetical protein